MSGNQDQVNAKQPAEQGHRAAQTWDMSQERAFIENLLSQRFNFFMVFFTVVIAGAVSAKSQVHLQILLGIGAAIGFLLSSTLGRSQEKLDLILKHLFEDKSHPATIINRRAKAWGSRRGLIGIWIPRICSALLLVGFVLAITGCLKAAG